MIENPLAQWRKIQASDLSFEDKHKQGDAILKQGYYDDFAESFSDFEDIHCLDDFEVLSRLCEYGLRLNDLSWFAFPDMKSIRELQKLPLKKEFILQRNEVFLGNVIREYAQQVIAHVATPIFYFFATHSQKRQYCLVANDVSFSTNMEILGNHDSYFFREEIYNGKLRKTKRYYRPRLEFEDMPPLEALETDLTVGTQSRIQYSDPREWVISHSNRDFVFNHMQEINSVGEAITLCEDKHILLDTPLLSYSYTTPIKTMNCPWCFFKGIEALLYYRAYDSKEGDELSWCLVK